MTEHGIAEPNGPADAHERTDLHERAILLTGASRGIGRAIALELAEEGARLALTARDQDALAATAQACRDRGAAAVWTKTGDLRDAAFIADLAREAEAELGPLWALVNDAGLGGRAAIEEMRPDHWDDMFAVNVRAPFLLLRQILPGMKARRGGHIVNIASIAGTTTFAGGAGYCASKWALMALTDVLTTECKPFRIQVTAVCPGSVQTDFGGTPGRDYSLRPRDVALVVRQALTARRGAILNTILMRPQVPTD